MRSDARENEDRILHAARAAFAHAGADTSLKAIAAAAGVGIGTLYRRFPTREHLVEAVYRDATDQLAGAAEELLSSLPADQALRRWFDLFLDYMLTKHGMAEALPALLADREGLRLRTRHLLHDAVARLLDAGGGDVLRRDVTADDVVMAIGGVALVAAHEDDRDLAGRLADLLLEGLRR